MSYIRCLSNPEGLYIIGTRRGQIEVMGDEMFTMPRHVFEHVALRWNEGFRDKITYRGLTVEEKWVGDYFRILLTYKNHQVTMWEVTWEYIVNGIYRRYHEPTHHSGVHRSNSRSRSTGRSKVQYPLRA